MAEHKHLDPSGFVFEGSTTGVLCVHGFSGSPTEMRPIAEALHQKGITVSAPCVAGHGTALADFKASSWQQWNESVSNALYSLKKQCNEVFIVAQSAGVLMSQHVLEEHHDVQGFVALAPAFYAKTYLLPAAFLWRFIQKEIEKGEEDCLAQKGPDEVWSYGILPTESIYQFYQLQKSARALLKKQNIPLLVMYGMHDKTVHPKAPKRMFDLNANHDKELIFLEKSAHMLTVDKEREFVAETVVNWILARANA